MMPRRGRRAERQAVADATPRTRNYRRLRHPFAPQSVLSADTIIEIHATALRVLSELGVRILLPEARDLFRKNNALVDDDEMVRIGAVLVEQALQTAPRAICLRASSAEREQAFEPGAMLFMAGAGSPNATDLERGRRPGSLLVRFRHYAMMRAQPVHGDKPMFAYARGRRHARRARFAPLDGVRLCARTATGRGEL